MRARDSCGNHVSLRLAALIGLAACLWGAAVLAVSQTGSPAAASAHASSTISGRCSRSSRRRARSATARTSERAASRSRRMATCSRADAAAPWCGPATAPAACSSIASRARPSRRCRRTSCRSTRRRSRSSVSGSIRARAPRRRRRRPRRRGRRRWRSIDRRRPPVRWRSWTSTIDRFVAAYLGERRAMEPAAVSDALFARRVYLDVWGLLPSARRVAARFSPIARPPSATRSSRACCRQPEVRRPLDLVLERPAAQRGWRHATFRRRRAARASPTGCIAALVSNLPYDQFVSTLINPTRADRSRRVRRRRELARRDERRGHAVDAGLAEHRADLPRREPEVQRLPRQLRQQMEAEGRVRARRLLLAGGQAAALPLRRRAGCVRRAGVPLSRVEPRAAIELARPIGARRRRRSSPIRATAGSPARSSIASGNVSSATASSPTPTRWTASRGARRCSMRSPAISSSTATTSSTSSSSILTSRAYQMPAVARTRRGPGARLRVRRTRGPSALGRAIRATRSARSPASGASISRAARAAVAADAAVRR